MKKRIIATLVTLAMILSLTACGNTKKEEVKEEPVKETVEVKNEEQEVAEKDSGNLVEEKIAFLNEEQEALIKNIKEEYEIVKEEITTYDEFKEKSDLLTDWYELLNSECEAFFSLVDEQSEEFYREAFAGISDEYELSQAVFDYEMAIYENAYTDIYSDVNDMFTQAYDDFCMDILSEAYNNEGWLEVSESASSEWTSAIETFSENWTQANEHFSNVWLAVQDAVNDSNADIDEIIKSVEEKSQEENTSSEKKTSEKTETSKTEATKSETTSEKKEARDENEIRPEFQKAMDEYIEFFEEYCEFMKLYNETTDTSKMLTQYMEYMTQYMETMEALEAIDESELTEAELKLYLDTTLTIDKMIIDVM